MEAEALLLGVWKNVEDLEEHISLDELQVILGAGRDREMRNNRFMAAIQGIDIDANEKEEQKERFEQIQRRADARLQGKSEDELTLDILGLDVEIEE